MSNNKYKLRYLPLFYEDLNEKVEYIAYEKLNPDAALRLIDNVEAAILERLPSLAASGWMCGWMESPMRGLPEKTSEAKSERLQSAATLHQ